jgi:uncharacterized small protein (DUF1192 family)
MQQRQTPRRCVVALCASTTEQEATMARITKAELEQQVAALQAQVEELKAQLAREAMRPAPRPAYTAPAWQQQRAQQMAAARELAMRIGRSVKVS